jgi:thiosulfate reductase cytochrome b subunit
MRGYTQFYGWRVETTGWLGVQETEVGPFPRAFPSALTIPGYFWLAGGRRWHFFFAWLFAVNGLLYVIYNIVSGHLRKLICSPRDFLRVVPMLLYYLRLRRESPQEGEYNPLQKTAYTGVLFVVAPTIILSGLAMSPQLNAAFNWLPEIFGGRQSARSVHFILTFLFAFFTLGHVFMALATGMVNNLRSITTGWQYETAPATARISTEDVIKPETPISAPLPSAAHNPEEIGGGTRQAAASEEVAPPTPPAGRESERNEEN